MVTEDSEVREVVTADFPCVLDTRDRVRQIRLLMPAVVTFFYLLKICLEGRKSNCFFPPKRQAEQFQKFELMSDDPKPGMGC